MSSIEELSALIDQLINQLIKEKEENVRLRALLEEREKLLEEREKEREKPKFLVPPKYEPKEPPVYIKGSLTEVYQKDGKIGWVFKP